MRVSVIGSGEATETERGYAEELGRLLAKNNHAVVCGGLGGVMEAVCRGAHEADGNTIGVLPGNDPRNANPYVETAVATGMGNARNALVALNGDAAVAVGGSTGTLSEIGHALDLGRPVAGIDTWEIEGVEQVSSPREALSYVEERVP